MLKSAAILLLQRSGLRQAAAAATTSGWHQCSSSSSSSSSWGQTRSKSDVAAASDPAAALASMSEVVPGDLATSGVLAQADQLVEVCQVASDAVVMAAKGDCWFGTRQFIDLLLWSHDSIGMPWVEAIAVSNLMVRLATLPFTVVLQKMGPTMQAARAEAEKLGQLKLRANQASSASEYAMRMLEYNTAAADFQRRHKGNGRLGLLVPVMTLAQLGLFISQFSAVSTLAKEKLPSMTLEGVAWFSDLTLPDPYWGLPVICAGVTLAMLNSNSMAEAMGSVQGSQSQLMKKIMTMGALSVVPFGGFVPSAVALLWACNALLSIGQNNLLASPGFRQLMGLPLRNPAAATNSFFGKMLANVQQQQPPAPKASPPPGTPPAALAVNYLPHKPRPRKTKP